MDAVVIIARFKETLQSAGYSKATVSSYSRYLSYFSGWLTDNGIGDLKQVNAQKISDYQAFVCAKPLAAETRAVYMRAVKRFFEHLTESHRLLINPAEHIVETDRKNRKLGPVLSQKQIKRILLQPNLSTACGLRDRAVLEVLYATAVRRNELLNLCVHDADLKDNVLYIRKGKGRVQRVVPLTKTAASYVKEYVARIRPRWARKQPEQRRLFLINTGNALTGGALQTMIGKYRQEANIKQPVSPHTLRRSCATHMLRSGADIRYIQALLGHRNLRTTQIYTRVAAADVKQTHNKTHPGKYL